MRWSGPEQQRKPFQKSAGPVKPARHVPPYLPISFSGLMTSGSWPIRSATGGSLPALTRAVSCGDSLKLLGNLAGSVTTSGPSSLPIRVLLPAFCASAPAAMAPQRMAATRTTVSRDRTVRICTLRRHLLMTRLLVSRGSNQVLVASPGADYRDMPEASPESMPDRGFPVLLRRFAGGDFAQPRSGA